MESKLLYFISCNVEIPLKSLILTEKMHLQWKERHILLYLDYYIIYIIYMAWYIHTEEQTDLIAHFKN